MIAALAIVGTVSAIGTVLDNALVSAWALRSSIKTTGENAISRHWPGSEACLALRLASFRVDRPPGGVHGFFGRKPG